MKIVKIKRKEIQRNYEGVNFYSSDGAGKFSYVQAIYKVTYQCIQGKKEWFETNLVLGAPIYLHKHPTLGLAHRIGAMAIGEILTYMRNNEIV